MCPRGEERSKAFDQLADRFGYLTYVLGPTVDGVRSPDLNGQISVVLHLEARCTESFEESGRPEYRRRLVLSGGIATCTTWNANDRDGVHVQECRPMPSAGPLAL